MHFNAFLWIRMHFFGFVCISKSRSTLSPLKLMRGVWLKIGCSVPVLKQFRTTCSVAMYTMSHNRTGVFCYCRGSRNVPACLS